MSVVAAAIIGGAVVGAGATYLASQSQSEASQAASQAQVQSNQANIDFQKEVFEQQREDTAPWREIGAQSLEQLQEGIQSGRFDLGNFKFDFEADPGYQFRMQEGVNALDRSASARGRLLSGAQQKALTRYGQNVASQEYSRAYGRATDAYNRDAMAKTNQFNQLASLAQVGQVATQQNQQASQNMAANVGASTTATGNAIAQNALNQGNINATAYQNYATGVNQGLQNYLLYQNLGAG